MGQITQDYLNETILHGGIPLKRADVYALMIEDGFPPRAADLVAFGVHRRAVDAEPWTAEEARALFAEVAS